jgi:hypothetical protein
MLSNRGRKYEPYHSDYPLWVRTLDFLSNPVLHFVFAVVYFLAVLTVGVLALLVY